MLLYMSKMNDSKKQVISPIAAVSAILGLAGLAFWVLGIAAVILALVGILHISQSKGALRGQGLCLLGAILGLVAVGLPFLLREMGAGKF